jgi:hypothetical protein
LGVSSREAVGKRFLRSIHFMQFFSLKLEGTKNSDASGNSPVVLDS